ncbi:PAS domain S-box protein [Chlorobium sp. BLA1]|uniref:PAS domain S-box protein n=1 Tax=Candidatus Chlorobium masyuteum TaxID=2716876 RepID=UPI001421679D|nr:PAS domain S-box protein [Candidatus Chlorobium masyuteum]NHQ59769.1 PAS domain S-box protein [Candidatus Chlorobium masyuteum]NTU44950.1 PAS domain S-box protein [Chlorobiaceae bacterium]
MNKEKAELFSEQERLHRENEALRKNLTELEKRASTLEKSERNLKRVLDATHAGSWDWEIKTGKLAVNEEWAAMIGFTLGELEPITINTWVDRCHPEDLSISNQLLEDHFSGKTEYYEMKARMRHKLGNWVWVLDRGKVFERDAKGNPVRMIGSHQNITQKKESERAVEESRHFEQLVSELSNQFITLHYEKIDELINSTLRLIGEFVLADRSYIFQFRNELTLMDNSYEWCAEGIEPQIDQLQEIPTDMAPWWMDHIKTNRVIHIPRISEMPPEASAEKEILEAQDIKSLIVIPLIAGSSPFGYIGFDAVSQEREWLPEIISVLKLAGGIIASALQRKQIEQFIQKELDLAIRLNQSSSFLETLQICLQAAISASGMDCGGIYLVNKQEGTLSLAFHQGLQQSFIEQASSYPLDSANVQLILKGDPIYQPFCTLIYNKHAAICEEKLQAIAVVPISFKAEVIACLNIASHTHTEIPEFSRIALETLASHIGSAIMQAHHEKEIEAAKINLESLFNTVEDFLFIVNMEGKVIHTNDYVRNRLGYTAEELHNLHVLSFHPQDQQAEAKANIEGMLAGTEVSCLVPLITKSGTRIPVETKVTPGIWNSQPVLFGMSRDVSERMRSELALKESEKRFRELTELLPLPLFETDKSGRITYSNQKGFEIFGSSENELDLGLSFFQFCPPGDHEKWLIDFESVINGTTHTITKEYNAIKKDGNTFPVLLYASSIMQNGIVTGARGIGVDLTELKAAEEAVRTSLLRQRIVNEFQSLIDNIPGTVYRTNEQGKTTLLSMSGDFEAHYTIADLEKDLFETGTMIHPEDHNAVSLSNMALRSTKTSQALIYRIVMKNGELRWIEERKTSVFSSDGQYSGVDGILFDITDRITAQEEKLQLESRLRKTQRLETIGTLAGGIAHDFNNILTPILGYAEMGELCSGREDSMHEYFTEITKAAERAKNLVAQILTFSRTSESSPDIVSVQSVIEEALKLLRPSIPSTISIEQDIDQSCRNIFADSSQIHQIIVNLCTNSFHAMEERGGVLTIELREIKPDSDMHKMLPNLQAESYMQLRISDTGTGMDEATMERIFEPFFTTKSVGKGTGLGLSVVHGIIKSFHGEITVESQPGVGSTFIIYLPVVNEKTENTISHKLPPEGKGNILFVDDEPATLRMMTLMMTRLGFRIEARNSPLEALELFRKKWQQFNLVITDLTMPEMTGIDFADQLHKINSETPVILMTGYGKDIEPTNALSNYGIRRILKKPINLTQIASIINEVLSNTPHIN